MSFPRPTRSAYPDQANPPDAYRRYTPPNPLPTTEQVGVPLTQDQVDQLINTWPEVTTEIRRRIAVDIEADRDSVIGGLRMSNRTVYDRAAAIARGDR